MNASSVRKMVPNSSSGSGTNVVEFADSVTPQTYERSSASVSSITGSNRGSSSSRALLNPGVARARGRNTVNRSNMRHLTRVAAGHIGDVVKEVLEDVASGYILKRKDPLEAKNYRELYADLGDPLQNWTPLYGGETSDPDTGEEYLRLENLTTTDYENAWMNIHDSQTTTIQEGWRIDGCAGDSVSITKRELQQNKTRADVIRFLSTEYLTLVLTPEVGGPPSSELDVAGSSTDAGGEGDRDGDPQQGGADPSSLRKNDSSFISNGADERVSTTLLQDHAEHLLELDRFNGSNANARIGIGKMTSMEAARDQYTKSAGLSPLPAGVKTPSMGSTVTGTLPVGTSGQTHRHGTGTNTIVGRILMGSLGRSTRQISTTSRDHRPSGNKSQRELLMRRLKRSDTGGSVAGGGLQALRTDIKLSPFAQTHEFIGTSLLLIADRNGKCSISLIDLAKTQRLPDHVKQISHYKPWENGNHEDGILFGIDNMLDTWAAVRKGVESQLAERKNAEEQAAAGAQAGGGRAQQELPMPSGTAAGSRSSSRGSKAGLILGMLVSPASWFSGSKQTGNGTGRGLGGRREAGKAKAQPAVPPRIMTNSQMLAAAARAAELSWQLRSEVEDNLDALLLLQVVRCTRKKD
eukprot:g6403.t1